MCKIIEDFAKETAERAEERAEERTKIQIALDLLRSGKLTIEEIALYSRLALDRVKELAAAQ